MKRETTEVERPITTEGPHGLTPGDLFKVAGTHGAFRFVYEWRPDGSLSAFGPIATSGKDAGCPTQDAQWRSFRPSSVTSINGKRIR